MFVPPALKRPESPTEDINSGLLVSEHPDGVGSKSGLECVCLVHHFTVKSHFLESMWTRARLSWPLLN